jgi:hypothetical protein
MKVWTSLEYATVTHIRLLVYIRATNFACPTEKITPQPTMAAFFGLHRIVTRREDNVRDEHDFFMVFTIPGNNAVICSISERMIIVRHK